MVSFDAIKFRFSITALGCICFQDIYVPDIYVQAKTAQKAKCPRHLLPRQNCPKIFRAMATLVNDQINLISSQ